MSLIKKVAWMLAGRWIYNLVTLASFTTIVGLISPAEFGIFTLASTFIILSDTFFSDAVENLIVKEKGEDRDVLSTMFWVVLAYSAAVGLAVALFAIPFGLAYKSTPLIWATATVGAIILLQGTAAVPRAVLMRHGKSRSYAINSATSNIVGAVVGIAAAWAGVGFWSLIIQQACLQLVMLIVCTLASGFRPSRHFNRALAYKFARHVATMLWSTFLNVLGNRLDILMIGALFGSGVNGVYGLAKRLIQIIQDLVASSFDKILLSTLSRAKVKEQAEHVYRSSVLLQGVTAIPSFAGFAIVSPLLIPFVFGKEWADAATFVMLMAVGGVFRSIVTIERAQQMAAGQIRTLANVRLIELFVGLATTVPFAFLGPEIVAIAFSVRYVIGYLLVVISRVGLAATPTLLMRTASWLASPVLATFAMSFAVIGTLHQIRPMLRAEFSVVTAVVLGLGVFALSLYGTKRWWIPHLKAAG